MTHRDPARSIPSYASFVSALFPRAAGQRDLARLGREVCDHLRVGMENAIEARSRIGEERFLDIHHVELIADPIGTIRRVYDFLGFELAPAVENTMREWYDANRSGTHGTHRYTPEQFGLSAAQVRDDYDFYIKRFDVTVKETR
jgi:hypothetical protein